MKTTKTMFALSLALMFFAGTAILNAQIPLKKVFPSEPKAKPKMVCYTVRIDPANLVLTGENHFLIMMTDQNGRSVAPARNFVAGTLDYTFYEPGPVRGTRVARMVKLPFSAGSGAIPPTSKSGYFYPETCYLFEIHIPGIARDPGAEKQ
ncbi:MAG TPA: hypothetical protein PKG48_01690 [Bacteroidales bacterium]|nr:hypothetical protein [Bacteroidales bacterium]